MSDLLSSRVDPTGIMSLLTPIVTGGAITAPQGGATPESQAAASSAAMPAWLAFAQKMGQAAGPHYGPSQPIGPAIAGAMGAGYGTAVQAEMLPALQASAGMSLQQQQLALAQRQFDFDRERAIWGAFGNPATAGVSAVSGPPGSGAAGTGPTTGGLPGANGFGTPATTTQLAQLPSMQALPDAKIQSLAQQVAAENNWSPAAADQWARQLKVESGGLQTDPKTGKIITSSAGAQGVGQVMPSTFANMKSEFPDVTGDITDPLSNLRASAHYFNQGMQFGGGNLAATAAYYNGGPQALSTYLRTGQPMPGENANYLVKTGALASLPQGGGAAGDGMGPMVRAAIPGLNIDLGMVPQQVEAAARAAAIGASGNPTAMVTAYTNEIQKWQQARVVPGTVAGTQVHPYTGQVDPATLGSLPPHTLTPQERAANGFGGIPADIPIQQLTAPDGKITFEYLGGARGAQIGYQRYDKQNEDIMGSPAYQQWQATNMRSNAVLAGLSANNAPGDQMAIESFAKIFDPQAAVTEGKITQSEKLGGWGQTINGWLSQMGSGLKSALPPATRVAIANLMAQEMRFREGSLATQIATQRTNFAAQSPGADTSRVFPGWQPEWITKDSPEADMLTGTGYQTGTGMVVGGTQGAPIFTHPVARRGGSAAGPAVAAPVPPAAPVPAAPPAGAAPAPTPAAAPAPTMQAGPALPVPPAAPAPTITAGGVPLMPGGAPVTEPSGRPVVLPPVGASPAVAGGVPAPGGGGGARAAPATPPAPSAQGSASTPAVDPQVAAVPNFDKPGLQRVAHDIDANPTQYSPAFRAAVAAEIAKRLAAQRQQPQQRMSSG